MEIRFKTRADKLSPSSIHLSMLFVLQTGFQKVLSGPLRPSPVLTKTSSFCLHFATVIPHSLQGLPRSLLLGYFPNCRETAPSAHRAEDSCRASSVAQPLQGHLWSSDPQWEESHSISNSQWRILETAALSCRDKV